MPIYEYRCEQGHTFEVMQRMSDDPVVACQSCEAPAAAPGAQPVAQAAGEGERIVRTLAAQNAIPHAVIAADPADHEAWLRDGRSAVSGLLAG